MSAIRRVSFEAPVRSLHWSGDSLVDFVGGGQVLHADGSYEHERVFWAFGFDRVVVSPGGRAQILVAELGTKAIVTQKFKVMRELNRSFYCANRYEYPLVVFALPDGREVIAHCPDAYNVLEFEDLDSGERLTARESEAPDVFHSRLSASPDGRHLLSAGWVWHPWGVVELFDVEAALARPESLDGRRPWGSLPVNAEVEAACWLDNDRVAVSATSEEPLGEDEGDELQPGELGVWSISERRWISRCSPAGRVGTMHEVDGRVLALYGHAKLLDPGTGELVIEWPELATGTQDSSIRPPKAEPLPPVVVDSDGKRFAVGHGNDVTIVDLSGI